MAQQYFYDRVAIYLNGIAYLPDGQIRSFGNIGDYHTKIIHGFSGTGQGSGQIIGNREYAITWTEYLPQQSDYVNLRTYFIANPSAVVTVVQISLASGVAVAPSFVLTGVQPTKISIGASNEGEAMTRDCMLIALDSSNL